MTVFFNELFALSLANQPEPKPAGRGNAFDVMAFEPAFWAVKHIVVVGQDKKLWLNWPPHFFERVSMHIFRRFA